MASQDLSNKAQNLIIGLAGLFMLVILGLGVYFTHYDLEQLTRLTKEDGILEWFTFLLFSVGSFMMLFVMDFFRRHYQIPLKSTVNIGILVLAAVLFFGAMEEISWGQRLTGHSSSDFFKQHNAQYETNFHNLKVGDLRINKLIFGKLLFLVLLFHNLVLPIWVRKSKKVKSIIDKFGGFLPPLKLVGFYFLVVIGVGLVEHHRHKEILEVSGAIHYFSSIYLTYIMGVNSMYGVINKNFALDAAKVYCGLMVFLISLAWILSVGVRTMELP